MKKYITLTQCPFSQQSCSETCPVRSILANGLKIPVNSDFDSKNVNGVVVEFKKFKKVLKKVDYQAFLKLRKCKKDKRLRGIRNLTIPFGAYHMG